MYSPLKLLLYPQILGKRPSSGSVLNGVRWGPYRRNGRKYHGFHWGYNHQEGWMWGQWRPVPRGYFPTHPPEAPRDPPDPEEFLKANISNEKRTLVGCFILGDYPVIWGLQWAIIRILVPIKQAVQWKVRVFFCGSNGKFLVSCWECPSKI